jgi:hypothetical protein
VRTSEDQRDPNMLGRPPTGLREAVREALQVKQRSVQQS